MFRCLPVNIETLVIVKLHTTNWFNDGKTPIFSKLKYLEMQIQLANEFSNVTKIFPNSKLFHLISSEITNLDDLHLPVNIRRLRITSCLNLTNCLVLKNFFKLKVFEMIATLFSVGLFGSYDQCPKLAEFRFRYPSTSKGNSVHKLDQMKFPKNVESFETCR